MYESKLRVKNKARDVTYTVQDVVKHLDEFADISCLIYEESAQGYRPHSKDWLFKRLQSHADSLLNRETK